MKFTTLTESEYRKFWSKYPARCFLSAPEISHLHENAKVFFLGVKDSESGKTLAAAMVRGFKRRFGKYDFYAPRGVLVDYQNEELTTFFLRHLLDFLKRENGYIFRMDPNLELAERDLDGCLVPGGRTNQPVVDLLKSLGFKKSRYVEGVSQVTWEFVLPVKGKTKDDIYNNMGPKARRRLRQALDLGIKIKDLDRSEIKSFYDILVSTAERKSFATRDFTYFEKMYDLFAPSHSVEFVSAMINPKKTVEKLKSSLAAAESTKTASIRDKKAKNDAIKSFKTRIEKINQIFPGLPDKDMTLSSGMFMVTDPEILHFLGGNVGEYLNLDAQYVLQWEMIGRAIDRGCDLYNFYGIPANIDQHPAGYGIYAFKRGFSGHVVELIGEYEAPLSPVYYLNKALTSLKALLKH